ncbi:hypothetical protein ES703_121875 [subsurface metagenome]
MVGVNYRGGNRMLMLFFLIVVIADGCFIIHASEAAGRTGFVQDCLGERGFAGPAVS